MPDSPVKKPKALIIDDEPDICYLLSSILRQKNFQTVFVGSISEAEKLIEQDCIYSIIFLDNHLPDGMGVNYIVNLKQKCPTSTLVMITAYDTIADREKAQERGADFFIGKPFTKDLIFKTLESLTVEK